MKPNKTDFFRAPFVSKGATQETAKAAPPSPSSAIERGLLRRFMTALGSPRIRLSLWDGNAIEPFEPPRATVVIRDRKALWRLLIYPSLYFGEDYASGQVDIEGSMVALLEEIHRARLGATGDWIQRLPQPRNSVSRARRNIYHHYDIGNPFYRLWLDEDMVYTCAYFPDPAMSLAAAQHAKMAHVCRKLRLQAGDTVVEAGCGWGSLARYMAREHGVKVRAYNISSEQIAYARERVKAEGLADRVEYIEDDYRNIRGEYDAFVSVGMLEHVGRDNYPVLGQTIDRVLKDGGRGLIHSIGQDYAAPLSPWLRKHIFPGAYAPTLREAMAIFEPAGLSVLDVENLRQHYAKTLEHWLARFEEHVPEIENMFDAWFVRTWRMYLCGSLASFSVGALQLFQIVFARPGADQPWSRAYLYAPQTEAST